MFLKIVYKAREESYGDAVLIFMLEACAQSQGSVFQGYAKGSASSVPEDSDLEGRPQRKKTASH